MSKKKYFVDLPMLDRFTTYHRRRLIVYADMMFAIRNVSQMLFSDHDAHQHLEAAKVRVDKIASILTSNDPYATDTREYLMVNYFLDSLRCGLEGESMHYQGIEVRNYHRLVEVAISRAAFDWRDSRNKYYSATGSATELFKKEISLGIYSINELYALLAAEYAKAREILLAQPEMPQ